MHLADEPGASPRSPAEQIAQDTSFPAVFAGLAKVIVPLGLVVIGIEMVIGRSIIRRRHNRVARRLLRNKRRILGA